MDRIDLKALICLLRESGLTFTAISDELKNKYNIEMSRQAVCSSYKRALKDVNNNVETLIYSSDILHYHLIGITHKEIVEIINNSNVTMQKVSEILGENPKSLEIIRENQLDIVKEHIESGMDMVSLRIKLSYHGIYP